MVSQIKGRKPSQQGVFLFQVELAGQNVICDEKESGQEKDFQSDAQQQNNMNGPVIGYGENPLSSQVPQHTQKDLDQEIQGQESAEVQLINVNS